VREVNTWFLFLLPPHRKICRDALNYPILVGDLPFSCCPPVIWAGTNCDRFVSHSPSTLRKYPNPISQVTPEPVRKHVAFRGARRPFLFSFTLRKFLSSPAQVSPIVFRRGSPAIHVAKRLPATFLRFPTSTFRNRTANYAHIARPRGTSPPLDFLELSLRSIMGRT